METLDPLSEFEADKNYLKSQLDQYFRGESRVRIYSAWSLAGDLHAGKLHGEKPYENHLVHTVLNIIGLGFVHDHEWETVAAGFLHDAPEDCGEQLKLRAGCADRIEAVEKLTGSNLVARIVKGVTRDPGMPYPVWLRESLLDLKTPWQSGVVKLGDKLHNTSTIATLQAETERVAFRKRKNARNKYGSSPQILWEYYRERIADNSKVSNFQKIMIKNAIDRVEIQLAHSAVIDAN